MASRVAMSQLGLFFASPPRAVAANPNPMPIRREAIIWLPKEAAQEGNLNVRVLAMALTVDLLGGAVEFR